MEKLAKFPVIDMEVTGKNIQHLREERGLTVRDVQNYFGFEEPSAIYMWQRGKNLPTVDNLCALSKLFEVMMDDIIVLGEPYDSDGKRNRAAAVMRKQTSPILVLAAA